MEILFQEGVDVGSLDLFFKMRYGLLFQSTRSLRLCDGVPEINLGQVEKSQDMGVEFCSPKCRVGSLDPSWNMCKFAVVSIRISNAFQGLKFERYHEI